MPQEFHSQLEKLRQQFAASLPEQARRLEHIWGHLRHLNWSEQGIAALEQFAHKMAETSTSFGFGELRQKAGQLESYIRDLKALGRHFGGPEYAQVAELVKQLSNSLNNRQDPTETPPAPDSLPEARGKTVFLIDPDRTLATLCTAYLRNAGFTVEYFDNPQTCMQRLYLDSPDVILFDPDFEGSGLQALGNLRKIKSLLLQNTPIVLMSGRTDLNAKLRALRAGSTDYLIKPVDFNFLVEKLVQLINQNNKTYKVMVVDDDEAVANLQAEILRYAGMEVLCVNQPLHSLQHAAQFKPDLVILDMHMPDINGMELAVLLRQDPEFLLLPIIFVTADTDINLHRNIRALGVNALLTKPFEADDLIERCRQALTDTTLLKTRVARITRHTQKPQQINRSYFFSALEEALHGKNPGGQASALYYVSVDKLPELGQQLGQVELIGLHEHFCEFLDEILGSDEQWADLSNLVACVLAGKRNLEFHRQRAEQISKYLSNHPFNVKGKLLSLDVKLGVVLLEPSLATANNALQQAEQAFEQQLDNTAQTNAQDTPPTTVAAVTSTLATKAQPDFSQIVFNRDLQLAFQPIISLEEPQIEHFSVLTRLRNGADELIPASQFLGRINQPGKRLELDRWVLQQAVSAIAENSSTRELATLFIHLAEETLQQSSFFSFAANVLRSSRLRGEGRLVFMLEESWLVNHFHQAREIAKALRDIRCSICITRAGENEQALDILEELPLSFLRLSSKLTNASNNPKLLERYVTLANKKGVQVIATQIENSRNLSSLWMQGVRLFEGFFIQPPDEGFHLKNDIIFAREFAQDNNFNLS
ncbi:response regulator [Cellvibrio mixtus]|uniref:response regulator n=1 Tax=Cellvibrio mixtus TaxID=39650 RepID=UPI00058779B3|nr:EAL domain-containing protein [Cellvibrio mixtus]